MAKLLHVFQPTLSFYNKQFADTPLLPNIITLEDPRWDETVEAFRKCKIFGYDIETYGKKRWHPLYAWKGYIRLIQISVEVGNEIRVLIIDLGGWRERNNLGENYSLWVDSRYSEIFEVLKDKAADLNTAVLVTNGKFDIVYSMVHIPGIRFRQVRDLMIMSQVYWAGVGVAKSSDDKERTVFSHGYAHVIKRTIGKDIDKTEQTSNWGWVLSPSQINYAAVDVIDLHPAYKQLRTWINQEDLAASAWSESLALPVFAEMEFYGFPVIISKAKEIITAYTEKKDSLEVEWHKTMATPYTQTEEVLLELQQKYPEAGFTTTSKDDLLPLLNEYPILQVLMDLRTINIGIRYVENVISRSFGDPLSVHTYFRQIATAGTGRSSCESTVSRSKPKAPDTGIQLQNPMNTPDHFLKQGLPSLRSMFGPDNSDKPEEDHEVLLVVDLPQAHNVIAAQMSGDETMKDLYETGKDAHIIMGLQLAAIDGKNYSYEQFAKLLKYGKMSDKDYKDSGAPASERSIARKVVEYRKAGKVGNYSGLNLGGKFRIANALRKQDIPATEEDASRVQKAYRTTYSTLYKWTQNRLKEINATKVKFDHLLDRYGKPLEDEYGVVKGRSGRRRFLMKRVSKYSGKLEVDAADACSFQWLSTEADLIKWAMGKILLEFDKHPEWGARFVNFAHDEINVVCRKKYSLEVAQVCVDIVYKSMNHQCPDIPFQIVKSGYEEVICEDWSQK